MGKKIKVKRLQGSPYAIEQQITGRGASATIVKAYNLQNLNQQLVSKIISISEEQQSGVYKTELQILKQLPNHPNLVNYKKVQITSDKNLYLIMQYCNQGNLDKYMFDCKYQISQQKIWFFLKQFCSGYKILYEKGLIHRDIKPENILIHNREFKIADFGLSKVMKDPDVSQNISFKGTPIYMAPQVPQKKGCDSKIDVFSLGIIIYRMAFKGEYPFFDQNRKYRSINEYFRQLNIKLLKIPENSGRSVELIQLIKNMLQKQPSNRISWKQIFEIPKIIKAFNPSRRKQISNMQQFKKSLIFVNKSVIKLQNIQQKQQEIQNNNKYISLVVQQAFNKTGKSQFQKKIYRHKLMYTLIEYANKKIRIYLRHNDKLHKYLKMILTKIIIKGLEFSLMIINSLRDVSGQWQSFTPEQIINFENIFDGDREILEEQFKKTILQQQKNGLKSNIVISQSGIQLDRKQLKIIRLSYQDILYNFLTQYFEYPEELKIDLKTIIAILIDIYDQCLKFDMRTSERQKSPLQIIQDEQSGAFYDYLLKLQSISDKDLINNMEQKGLLFK